MRAPVACQVTFVGAVTWAFVFGGTGHAVPIVLFSDNFDRADSDSLGPDWIEAEAEATKFRISSGAALLDVASGGTGGVDFGHAVTNQTFNSAGLGVQADTREFPIEGATIRYGIGFADTTDDDVDIIFFSIQGRVTGTTFDSALRRPDPTGPGFIADSLSADDPRAPPVNGFTIDTLSLDISPDRTSLKATFEGSVIFDVALDPADLPGEIRIKIGNPGADPQDTPGGPARSGDVTYFDLIVTQTVAVPEFPAILLLISGLAGLTVWQRRR